MIEKAKLMTPLRLVYWIRALLGVVIGGICALYNIYVQSPFPPDMGDLLRGISFALIFYLATYYIIKWRFLSKVEKPKKLVTMGIGVYFLAWIISWSLFVSLPSQAPVADFTYTPSSPKVGEMITFNATASKDPDGTIKEFAWNFGDGNITITEERSISHAYSKSGNYTVALMVSDNHGLTNMVTKQLPVTNATTP